MKSIKAEWLTTTLDALKTGDNAAFEALYRLYESRLYAFTLQLVRHRQDAEEVVQEVFLKVWEKRDTLDATQSFDGYLFTIAKNLVYNKARHKVHEFAFKQYLVAQDAGTGCFTEEAVAYKDLNKILDDICEMLPPVRKQVFIMSRVEGRSNTDIARLLNTSNSNVENHINKALKMIREKFGSYRIAYLLLLLFFCFSS